MLSPKEFDKRRLEANPLLKKLWQSGYDFTKGAPTLPNVPIDRQEEYLEQFTSVTNENQNYMARIAASGNEVPEKRPVLDALNKVAMLLDTPRNAIWNAIQDASTGENGFFQGLVEGARFKDREEVSGQDLMNYLFGSPPEDQTKLGKFARGAGGFLAEVLLDPLNLVTFGGGSLAKGFLTGTGKTLTKEAAEGLARAGLREITEEGLQAGAKAALKAAKGSADDLIRLSDSIVARFGDDMLGSATKLRNYVDAGELDKAYKLLTRSNSKLGKAFKSMHMEEAINEALKRGGAAPLDLAGKGFGDAYKEALSAFSSSVRDLSKLGRKKTGLSIAGKELASGAKMQDLGAAASTRLRQVPLVGDLFGKIQDGFKSIFGNMPGISGLDNMGNVAVKDIYNFRRGTKAVADRQLTEQAANLFRTLKEAGPEANEKVIRLLEKTLNPSDLKGSERALVEIADELASTFKKWGIDEKKIGALTGDLVPGYFPHTRSWDLSRGKQQKVGRLSERLKIDNPSNYMRKYGNDVFRAQTQMQFLTSSPEAQEQFLNALYENSVEALGGRGKAEVLRRISDKAKDPLGKVFAYYKGVGDEFVNSIARETLDGVEDYFETSVANVLVSRGLSHNRLMMEKGMLDDVLAATGRRISPEEISRTIRNGKDVVIPVSSLKAYAMQDAAAPAVRKNLGAMGKEFTTKKDMITKRLQATVDRLSEQMNRLFDEGDLDGVADIMSQIDDLSEGRNLIDSYGSMFKPNGQMDPAASRAVSFIKNQEDQAKALISLDEDTAAVLAEYLPIEIYEAPRGVVDYVNKITKHQTDESMKMFQDIFDKFNNLWKPTVTGLRPDFNIRNFIGSTQQNLMDIGMKTFDPSVIARANKAAFGKNLDEAIRFADGTSMTIRELRDGFVRSGANASMFRGDIKGFEKLTRDAANSSNILEKIAESGRRVGQFVEDEVRWTNYIANMDWAIERGMTKEAAMQYAGNMVKQFHFDYTDLSKFEQDVLRRVFPFYCVDEETEILTENGWLRYSEVKKGLRCLTLNTVTNESEWQPIEDIAVFDYNGIMYSHTGKTSDLLVTPDHRCVVVDDKGKVRIERAYEVRTNHKFPTARKMADKPSSVSTREAAILGWAITDGHVRKRGNSYEVVIYQSPKKFLNEIVELLGDNGSVRAPHPETGVVPVGVIGGMANKIGALYEDLSGVVSALSLEAAEAMWDAMYKADGVTSKTRRQAFFAQEKGPIRDIFQTLSILLGKTANLAQKGLYIRVFNFVKFTGWKPVWYTGKVWCVKTSNSTWMMRRNGKHMFTGNTFTRKNLPLQFEMLFNKPSRLMVPGRYNRNMNEAYDVNDENMPEWFQEQLPLSMPFLTSRRGEEEGRTAMLNAGLPMSDVVSWTNAGEGNLLREVLGMASPMVKVPFEVAMNQKMVSGAPIAENDYERREEVLKHIFSQFLLPNDARRAITGENLGQDTRAVADQTRHSRILNAITRIMKEYSPAEGELDAEYERNRELGNYVQYLRDQGQFIPDTQMAKLFDVMTPEEQQYYMENGFLPDYMLELIKERVLDY